MSPPSSCLVLAERQLLSEAPGKQYPSVPDLPFPLHGTLDQPRCALYPPPHLILCMLRLILSALSAWCLRAYAWAWCPHAVCLGACLVGSRGPLRGCPVTVAQPRLAQSLLMQLPAGPFEIRGVPSMRPAGSGDDALTRRWFSLSMLVGRAQERRNQWFKPCQTCLQSLSSVAGN